MTSFVDVAVLQSIYVKKRFFLRFYSCHVFYVFNVILFSVRF